MYSLCPAHETFCLVTFPLPLSLWFFLNSTYLFWVELALEWTKMKEKNAHKFYDDSDRTIWSLIQLCYGFLQGFKQFVIFLWGPNGNSDTIFAVDFRSLIANHNTFLWGHFLVDFIGVVYPQKNEVAIWWKNLQKKTWKEKLNHFMHQSVHGRIPGSLSFSHISNPICHLWL